MELGAYLDRIGYSGPVRRDLETLRGIQRAHALAVPYENFDVQFRVPLTTDPAEAYDKIVARRRGGWCYENNGVLGWALAEAGFAVTRLCGVGQGPGSHLVLQVDLDDPWICDVGTGEGPLEPYPLKPGPFIQRGFEFNVAFGDGFWRLVNHRFAMVPQFEAHPTNEALLSERCAILQDDPASVFRQNVVVFRQDTVGYTSLVGKVMRRVTAEGVEKSEVGSVDEYVSLLGSTFGLDLPKAADLWPSILVRHEEILVAQAAKRAAAQPA